jgi:DNA-binding NarL/FixJ family response regulator
MPLRVVFAEDNYLVRQGTSALLGQVPEVNVVAVAEDVPGLLAAVAEQGPDAVLTDIRMPPTFTDEGITAALRIRREYPGIGVVVLSQYVEGDYALDLLRDGVAGLGYLLKERIAQVEDLVTALTQVAAGGSVLDPKVVEQLVVRRAREDRSPLAALTTRETEVLREMACGHNNAAIARRLFLSDRAVEKHINAVFHKLGLSEDVEVNRRVKAVLTFLDATRS